MPIDLHGFHRAAVETPSHDSVEAMRDLLVETLESAGLDPWIDDSGTVRAERSAGDGGHLLLNTHLDTVPPHRPYRRDGDRIYGRGSCDAKGPLAAMIHAFEAATIESGRVTLAITPDEETSQHGAAHLAETLAPDHAIVGEPTGLDVCVGARGQFEGTITLSGASAHAAGTDGINAVAAAGPVLDAIGTFDRERGPAPDDRLGPPSLTATEIAGGTAPNRVPETCTITFDRRPVPPETPAAFRDALTEHLDAALDDAGNAATVRVTLADREAPQLGAFRTPDDASVVTALRAGGAGSIRAFGAATEASLFADRVPTAIYGPGVLADSEGPVAHADREYVERDDLDEAAKTLTTAIETLC
ncbi:M20/M25/M40 family metallo-hydrolase [Halococcoides cellulosivorans]|uniref:Succinyl-diaminopimelate desuccinylase n=1 Tax=Halococcoides cellulosivorans TaxID=1679096 RepID=A0A2R4WXN6_9EURY|nr:M20/M25/M40 family metallo-hydrolase [Halococcoides cellulosivorans]AWB26302.1 succinyl-diaminopimelate desuccinylase [Halococcoides cellulosivorans]